MDKKILKEILKHIANNKGAPNTIIMNNNDFINFTKMIENSTTGLKIDINGEVKYMGMIIIRTLNVPEGVVKVCFID